MFKKVCFFTVFFFIILPSHSHVDHYKNLKKLEFDLFRNNKQIGTHVYVFNNDGKKLTVKSDEIKGEIKEFNKEKYINIVEAKDNKKVYIENQNMKSYSKSAIYSKDNNLLELFDEVKIIKGNQTTLFGEVQQGIKKKEYAA